MTAQLKAAYRHLLYVAMLDIRAGCNQWCHDESGEPQVWQQQYRQARYAGGLAYWLHNLALASAEDFEKFDEVSFWQQHGHFCGRFPGLELERYRIEFDQKLKGIR